MFWTASNEPGATENEGLATLISYVADVTSESFCPLFVAIALRVRFLSTATGPIYLVLPEVGVEPSVV